MIDHYPRIRAQQQRDAELAEIRELEACIAPLIWLVYTALFLIVMGIAVDGWRRYEETAAYYADLAAEHEALVQCIRGRAFKIDTEELRCEITKHKKLVGGLKS